MGDRYLIVVRSEFLKGAEVAQASGRTLAGLVSHLDVMSMRRVALEQLAAEILAPGAMNGLSAAAALSDVRSATQQVVAGPPANVSVLEGIGGLIVDEDDCPRNAFLRNTVLEVIPNFDIELIAPTVSAQATSPWHISAMGMPQPEKGRGVLIGILDTGIDASHPEFSGKTVHFQEFDRVGTPLNSPARDAGDHGTHVCGIVAGATCGIAPNADLAVAAALTTNNNGRMSGSLLQIAAGLNWLLTHPFRPPLAGVDAVNASLGTGVPTWAGARSGYNSFLATALRTARLAPGVLMIASIGNDGRRGEGFHGSPGNYGDVFSVGAVDNTAGVADFSDWDQTWTEPGTTTSVVKPTASAPGVGILSSKPGGGFQTMSGTSMAAPMVSGVAALLLERQPSLRGSPAALEAQLRSFTGTVVTPHPSGNGGGAGQVRL